MKKLLSLATLILVSSAAQAAAPVLFYCSNGPGMSDSYTTIGAGYNADGTMTVEVVRHYTNSDQTLLIHQMPAAQVDATMTRIEAAEINADTNVKSLLQGHQDEETGSWKLALITYEGMDFNVQYYPNEGARCELINAEQLKKIAEAIK